MRPGTRFHLPAKQEYRCRSEFQSAHGLFFDGVPKRIIFDNAKVVKFLPDSTVCVLSDKTADQDPNAKIVLSTYQTLINKIDCEDKEYGIFA
jgi:hypothetical protein